MVSAEEISNILLHLVKELVTVIHPSITSTHPVSLDSALDKDLGLDSLMRMELLSRIEQAFDTTLSERIFSDAETPRDLWRAIQAADFKGVSPATLDVVNLNLETLSEVPLQAQTLLEVLIWHVKSHPDRPHVQFYDDNDEGEGVTYQNLWDGAVAIAAGLQKLGVQTGEPVALMLPSEPDYFYSFFGVLMAGGIPAPLYPPPRLKQLEDHLQRQFAILNNCAARVLIAIPEAIPFSKLICSKVPSLENLVTASDLATTTHEFHPPPIGGQDLALLQYTSGSTGNPKGVALTHANLLSSIRVMGQALEVTSSDIAVSWLPLYHDMGLIGAWLGSIYQGVLLVIMPPLSFMARPIRWLRAIHRYRATISVAPNFAYELCLRKLTDKDLEGFDLSLWRVAMNGAEPVNPITLNSFTERFKKYGFQKSAIMPVFGLAECSLGLTFPPLNRGPVIDRIRREAFMRFGTATPVDDHQSSDLSVVACGQPLMGHEIRIVDSSNKELPERQEGRLQFRGPAATSGYFRNPEQTRLLFEGDWLDSGDMGYITEGDLYITGRNKDIIIRGGRNMYPHELEDAVSQLPGIIPGNVVAFGSPDPKSGTERLIVMAETRKRKEADKTDLQMKINEIASSLIGSPPEDVLLVLPKTVLRTSSGKIRRQACRELYEQNLIGREKPVSQWQKAQFHVSSTWMRWQRFFHNIREVLYSAYLWTWFVGLAPVMIPILILLPIRKWRWAISYRLGRFLLKVMRIPLKVRGLEKIPLNAPFMLVTNHASYIDVFILLATLPLPFRFVAKGELASVPIINLLLRRLQTEFVNRFDKQKGLEDARRISQAASTGPPLLYFPEGTFTRTPGLLPFHMGAFTTAVESSLQVVPIVLRGTRSMLRDESWFLRRRAITVTIGDPIDPESASEEGKDQLWQKSLILRDAARAYILRYCGEPDLAHEKSPI
jgi:1-acyl-sn-glycerol-3-phosphate acyltransferase